MTGEVGKIENDFGMFLVNVMQNTKYSLKIKQIHGEWNNLKVRGPSKSAPPSAVLQQTIKLKLKKKARM